MSEACLILCLALTITFVACVADSAGGATPRPEHPRPDMERPNWMSLNGPWDFADTDDDTDESWLTAESWPDTIVVPFCRESELSGLARRGFINNVWYRRTFQVPGGWPTQHVRLHIGACDYRTRVWVNGRFIGEHVGGNAAFAFDISDALEPGENTVIIHAHDNVRSRKQPLGKQSLKEESFGIFYTRTTGIWQTVWLEGVNESYIANHRMTCDADRGRVRLQATVNGPTDGLELRAVARTERGEVGSAATSLTGDATLLEFDVTDPHLWTPYDPFLYDLTLTLTRNGETIDRVDSYFGLRTVTVDGPRFLINGVPHFQRLVLDQGFYPDGVWTAPTDWALRQDITLSQQLGFNGARLHQKVFEPRFLYWADKLGYLVWGEYPSFGADYADPAVNMPIMQEWAELVERDFNHPSVIGWCPFNETPPDAGPLQNAVVALTRSLDPTRPVLDTSGWTHSLVDPIVSDAHDYDQDPASFAQRWAEYFGDVALPGRYGHGQSQAAFFVSEYGGIGWSVEGGWGYGKTPESLEAFYTRFAGLTGALLDDPRHFGLCYTQLTDVEQEKNGLYTFDRKPKFDTGRLHDAMARKARYEESPAALPASDITWRVILGGAPDIGQARPWRYTTTEPDAAWIQPDFDDSAWSEGLGALGDRSHWDDHLRTRWTEGKAIWLRQTFAWDGQAADRFALAMLRSGEVEVFVNNQAVYAAPHANGDYAGYDVTAKLRGALQEGENVIAVRCGCERWRFIDVAMLAGTR